MVPSLSFPLGVVFTAVMIAAVTDLWRFKVHNLLTLPLLIGGLFYHTLVAGLPGLGASLGGALFGFGILFLFYLLGGMGGGDVKLMAAVGAWLGLPLTFVVFLASSLAAGLYAVALTVGCGRVRETCVNLQILWHRVSAIGRHLGAEDAVEAEVTRPDRRHRIVPFAAMMAVGLLTVIGLAWWGGRT